MRLTKPSLNLNHPIGCDLSDVPRDSLNQILQQDLTSVAKAQYIGLGEFLTLPQNFG